MSDTRRPNVTAYLCTTGASDAIAFYSKAFGAQELYRLPNDDGTLGHAEVKIGETTLYLSDEAPQLNVLSPSSRGGATCSFVLDVDDVDAAFNRAVDAGAKVDRPIVDNPYGRGGWVIDPFGHRWSIMTANPDFDPKDMQ